MKWVPWEGTKSVIKTTLEKKRKDHLVQSKVKQQVRWGPHDDAADGDSFCHCPGHRHCHCPHQKGARAGVTILGTLTSCQVLYQALYKHDLTDNHHDVGIDISVTGKETRICQIKKLLKGHSLV